MKEVFKVIIGFFTLIFATLGLLTLYVFAINAFDASPSDTNLTMQKWLEQPQVSAETNAFEQLLLLAGEKSTSKLSLTDAQHRLLNQYTKACGDNLQGECQQFITDNLDAFNALNQQNQSLITQYYAIQQLTHWQEDHSVDHNRRELNQVDLSKIRNLAELNVLMQAKTQPNKLIQYLGNEYKLQLLAYKNAQYLDSHIMARNQLSHNITVTKQWFKQHSLTRTQRKYWQASPQLSVSNIKRILAGEWVFAHHLISELKDKPFHVTQLSSYQNALFSYFFQQTDSDNMNADYYVAISHFIDGSSENINNVSQAYCVAGPMDKLKAMRFNPIGKALNCSNKHNYLTSLLDASHSLEKTRAAMFNPVN
ncbi:hypothetical protein ACFOD0_06430 [Shewanella intestini]|uniref:Uncharacterized protein n=1 Tax=Shewanella intestini TaxID=2017544 RepID=A0ABS5HZP7_9GAMM|nr:MULTISPECIES: hypothetical protein [Shewanella]MBR9726515.1 hypothetical protein [Shewanella intestini]MRG34919.1 hypothetical protein [Shewanella sp. XMDDZSB0408]